MSNPYVLVVGTGIVVLIAIGLARRRYMQRRQVSRQLLEQRRQAGLALVRYVMLNRQCSEESAYQLIAAFTEAHSPAEDRSEIARLLANDRQGLLEKTGGILAQHPDKIDKI